MKEKWKLKGVDEDPSVLYKAKQECFESYTFKGSTYINQWYTFILLLSIYQYFFMYLSNFSDLNGQINGSVKWWNNTEGRF